MAHLLFSQYPMTKSQNKKPLSKNNDGGNAKGKGPDTDSPKHNSGNPLAGAHTTNRANNASSAKAKPKPSNTVGAHISDSDKYDHQRVRDLFKNCWAAILLMTHFGVVRIILMTTQLILKIVHRRWEAFMLTTRKTISMVTKFPQLLKMTLFMKKRLTRRHHD